MYVGVLDYFLASFSKLLKRFILNSARTDNCFVGARGGAVGKGTAIQAGRSRVRFLMVSLEFLIEIILPVDRNVGKGGRCLGLSTFIC
jgi:hypothetical protein